MKRDSPGTSVPLTMESPTQASAGVTSQSMMLCQGKATLCVSISVRKLSVILPGLLYN